MCELRLCLYMYLVVCSSLPLWLLLHSWASLKSSYLACKYAYIIILYWTNLCIVYGKLKVICFGDREPATSYMQVTSNNYYDPLVYVVLVCAKLQWSHVTGSTAWNVTVTSPIFNFSILHLVLNSNGGKTALFSLPNISNKWMLCLHRKNPSYKDSPPEATFVNVLGLLITVFGALILWIATRPNWKRPSEQLLQTLHNEPASVDTRTDTAMSDRPDSEPNSEARKRNGKTVE